MSRSFALERIRINVEIFCESIGDFLASSFGSLKRPLTMLAGLALVMTLRSARKGVQRMKRGGLIAGAHDATFKANYGYGKTSYGGGYGTKSATSGALKGSPPGYGSYAPGNNAYGSSASSTSSYTPGGATSTSYGGASGYSASASSSASSGYGASAGNPGYGASNGGYGATHTGYGAGSSGYGATGSYGSGATTGSTYGATGSMTSGQSPRALADLLDRHGGALRVLDAHAFKDYGGVHEFYGQVETLQAYEGAGVVEKVLQSPGMNKVLVVDGGGNLNVGIFGKTAAASAKQNGWSGVIIHGAIRDAKSVGQTAIGCKAMASNPNRGRATTGSKGSALNIAGMQITSGMWVYADKDGIALSDTELTTGGAPGAAGAAGVGGGGVSGYSQTGGTASGYSGQATGAGYGSGAQPGGYGAQPGSTGTGYGSTGGYGASSGTYGTQAGYGSGSSTGYGAGTSTGFGSNSATGYGSTSGQGYGARPGGAYPYSHAGARSGFANNQRDISVSTVVIMSMFSLMILPLELL